MNIYFEYILIGDNVNEVMLIQKIYKFRTRDKLFND